MKTTYILELTKDEAAMLRTAMSFVGGCSKTSPRRHADEIERALAEAGVPRLDTRLVSGDVYFAEKT